MAAAWLAAAIFDFTVRVPQPGTADFVRLVLAVLPPFGLGLLVAGLLPAAGRGLELAGVETRLADAVWQLSALETQLREVDTILAHSAGSVARLTTSAGGALPGLAELGRSAEALEASTQRVTQAGAVTQAIADDFSARLPALADTIGTVDAVLRSVGSDSAMQMRAVETMLAAVQARNQDAAIQADTAIANMAALLARIDEASTRNTAALSKRAYALDAAVDGVLERTTAAVDGIRERVTDQLTAMQGAVNGAGSYLAILGDDGARLFNQRLELLLRTSESLQARYEAHEAGSARLQETLAAHVGDVEARLAALGTAGSATLGDLGTQLAAVQDGVTGLAAPLAASAAAVDGLETQAGTLALVVAGVQAELAGRLAATSTAMADLQGDAAGMLAAVGALGESVSEGSALVDGAAAKLQAERAEVERLADALAGHFEAAQTVLAGIEASSAAAAREVAAGLGAEVERISRAGEAAAAELRQRLAIVIAEAVGSLETATSAQAEAAFGAPVRSQIAAIETATARAAGASQAAAARMAGHMLSLVETVSMVETRVGEIDMQFTIKDRESLATRSARVMDALNSSVVDLAELLSIRVSDADWGTYLGGDRTVFARAVAPQLDRERARQIGRLFRQDDAFRTESAHYCTMFEGLVQRLIDSRDGETMAAAMLSSDLGKIYVALADASERLPPQRAN
ncbi:hypothetical protein GCM10011529_16950 [Polymorphobacter glacialis]|uniref:Uncharacterized protein n=1 Tax=Sandarakinorhabdus glacialis TaxID=1614636 RepID=A0A916ZRV6_9SPHN|nr:hypothetical protein GCM10011529_16950 [Polymorphobacter glacialis]